MVKKVKQKKGNVPPENMVLEKLQGVLMWVLRNVKLGVKRLQKVLGRSNQVDPFVNIFRRLIVCVNSKKGIGQEVYH